MDQKIISLPNSLKTLSSHLPGTKSVTVLILVGTGSRYEDKRTNGIAHYAEHMFFKGTKKRPTALEISTLIDGIGGEFNAFTSKEYTGYFVKASTQHFELVMDVLSDMLQNSKFEQKEIDRERGVIFEELRMYLDTPVRYIHDLYEQLLFGDQPLGWDIVGTIDSLKNINRGQFLKFKDAYYNPENMLVSIAGGVSHRDTEVTTNKYLGNLKNKETAKFTKVKIDQKKPVAKVVTKNTEQAHLALGVRSYPRGHKNHYVAVVLNTILGSSMSSRLFIQLRERRGLAYYVRAGLEEYYDAGSFVASAGVPPKKIDEAIKVILDEYFKITKEKVGEKELKKSKEHLKGSLALGLEDSREVASLFGAQQLLEGKFRSLEEISKNIDKVTAEEIQSVAQEIFVNRALNLTVIGPYKNEEKFVKILKI
ncbi:MAG: pitrilysin family protein [bacterium]|nr:pitrilysin family protein [bacterium]